MKQISKMTKKELLDEYNSICQQIDYLSWGTKDLIYRDMLELEIEKRGYQLSYKFI